MFTRSPSFSFMGALGLGGTTKPCFPRQRWGVPKTPGAGVWEGPREAEAMEKVTC